MNWKFYIVFIFAFLFSYETFSQGTGNYLKRKYTIDSIYMTPRPPGLLRQILENQENAFPVPKDAITVNLNRKNSLQYTPGQCSYYSREKIHICRVCHIGRNAYGEILMINELSEDLPGNYLKNQIKWWIQNNEIKILYEHRGKFVICSWFWENDKFILRKYP